MLVAIIEFELNPGAEDETMSLMGALEPELETIDGFIAADTAQSVKHGGMLYELSYWRDADALSAWAANALHGDAMKRGRERLLKWYRIRVAEVARDWSVGEIPAGNPAAAGATS